MAEQITETEAMAAYRRRLSARESETPDYRSSWPERLGVWEADEQLCPPNLLDTIRTVARNRKWPVYLWGPTGVGKSRAAAVVFRKWMSNTKELPFPVWSSWPAFCDAIVRLRGQSVIRVESPLGGQYECDERDWWRVRWSTPQLAVIDEIGTRTANDVRLEAMWQFLEVRRGKPTIFTGNLSHDEIRRTFDDRVFSRLAEGTFIEVAGKDRRVIGFGQRSFKVGE